MYSNVQPCNAMYSHVLPCITMYYHVLPCIAMYSHVQPCNAMYSHVLPCITMYYYVLPGITMYGHVIPCIGMYQHVQPCITMYCHVLPCITMYSHVLPCIVMYCHAKAYITMYYHVLSCITMYKYVLPCVPCLQSRFHLSWISRERGSDSADIFKFFSSADHPPLWMSQTSFILDKPVLSVHARIFWNFADSFCAHAPQKNKQLPLQFHAGILRKLQIERSVLENWKMYPDSRWILFWI